MWSMRWRVEACGVLVQFGILEDILYVEMENSIFYFYSGRQYSLLFIREPLVPAD